MQRPERAISRRLIAGVSVQGIVEVGGGAGAERGEPVSGLVLRERGY